MEREGGGGGEIKRRVGGGEGMEGDRRISMKNFLQVFRK